MTEAAQQPNTNSVVNYSGGNTDGLTMVVHIKKTDEYFVPSVLDDLKLELHRKGAPGKMTFKVVRDEILKMGYGDTIDCTWKGTHFFHGFIFEKRKDKDDLWSVTAYDQMRYLLNKDTFSYVAKTATQVIRELAEDFELKVGDLDDTQYVISKHRDPDATILDMCQTALDLTLMQTGKIYVIYDDCGKLNLKEISKLKTDLYFDGETAGNYDYTGSIDKETANLIKLDLDNGQEGHQVVYAPANSTAYQQSATRKQWGVLQYYESLNPSGMTLSPQALANKLLEMKNHVRRTFKLKDQAGDLSIRGGSMAWLNVNIGDDDMETKKDDQAYQVIVDSVTHKFSNNCHLMDMDLVGSFLNSSDSGSNDSSGTSDSSDSSAASSGSGSVFGSGSDFGTGTSDRISNIHEKLTRGADDWVGSTMDNGRLGCAEAVTKVGSYYSPFLKEECQANVVKCDDLVADAGSENVIPFNANELEEGDVIVYDDNDHVVIYDGNGGYVGNSSSRDMVVNGSNYWEMDGMEPTKIIKTSRI
ncbi:XkdQ/YqbQ family protein [Acidaminococcus intestini]|jgi:hypothetical protein|uniref:XkdQ/YqbQ family protein n=1 Tax=Acidaminococcus intestini TaxID=187327 RepID=UPI00205FFD6D|nr:hypothetical protein [Acidaminococcus intestini]DAP59506.1 MAG TPA: 43 kDa tail protein [Caudoviricetes sp.]